LNNLKEALKSEDGERIKKTVETLEAARLKLGEAMYKDQAAAAGATPPPGAEQPADQGAPPEGEKKKDEDVIDAEYEVKE
jgi:molecular chaperone DnaK